MGLSGVNVPPSVLEPGRGVPVGWGHCRISPLPSALLCLGLQGSLRPWWGLAEVCWHWVLSWPFSEGSFQAASCPRSDPGPGTSRFPFQGNTSSAVLHVPITFRATEGDLQQLEVSQGGFSPALGPPAVKTPSGRTKDQGGDHDQVRSLLSAGLGCGAVWK